MPIKIFKPVKHISFKVKSVQVLVGLGPDKITLNFSDDTPTPFKNSGDPGDAVITAQAGYGVTWCKEVLGLKKSDIEVIVIPKHKSNFSKRGND